MPVIYRYMYFVVSVFGDIGVSKLFSVSMPYVGFFETLITNVSPQG
ncbi:hypothetical protein SAMN05661012_00813 [Chitinophaga sancti]|uniref:Uncharacterized protein n=1 Tax=Chitinophaga sancti TaxID=1004 RepID=A0A1K1MRG8_9BACT|nr:hypothetical protein SAMN05661012_00813 [Chitinophaga sancti]